MICTIVADEQKKKRKDANFRSTEKQQEIPFLVTHNATNHYEVLFTSFTSIVNL